MGAMALKVWKVEKAWWGGKAVPVWDLERAVYWNGGIESAVYWNGGIENPKGQGLTSQAKMESETTAPVALVHCVESAPILLLLGQKGGYLCILLHGVRHSSQKSTRSLVDTCLLGEFIVINESQ